ncbi:MAG: response regulator [Alphaproteobacteria bacterium]|nr:response regulator [Alphaproteobacteria bacterium]
MDVTTPHILVVDDDTRLRDLLRKYLRDNGFRVTTAATADEAYRKLGGLEFDLLVVDVMMPGQNGLDFTAKLRRESAVPILLLTAMGEPESRIEGFERGADDYLAKPFEPRELVLRIEAILRRVGASRTPDEISLGRATFDLARGVLVEGDRPLYLTSSEAQLLRIFAASPGVTLSRAELSRRIGSASERSVDVQVTRLRRRIEPDPKTPRYLHTVWGEGYVLWPDG